MNRIAGPLCLLIFVVLPVFTAIGVEPNPVSWPEWRGADGQGVSQAKNVPTVWSETQNIVWRTAVAGRGWSTPVIDQNQVWVTTASDVAASPQDAERRRKTSTNSQPLRISESVSLRVVGIDFASGQVQVDRELFAEEEPQMIHSINTYATPSPVIEAGMLYCHYGPSGMACYDTRKDEVKWINRDLVVKHENGPGSSPVLWGNLLILHCDGIDQQYIVALDKATGKKVWKTVRSGKPHANEQMRKSYATSLVTEVNGQPQVVSPAADWIYGYDPSNGKELWKLNYGDLGFSNAGRPVAGHGLLYTCTGYMKSQLLAIRIAREGDQERPTVAWQYAKQVPNVASPLLVGNELYFASDNGVATCIDAVTGEACWTNRIGKRYWASPLYADGKVYFFDRDGATTVIAAGRKFQKLSENTLEGTLFATAAAVDGALVLRTDKAIYRVGQTP